MSLHQTQPATAPRRRRSAVALCLSGGGFRAASFHLGALRRLNELGVLARVDTISSVSGGSIIAAHMAERVREWPVTRISEPEWEQEIAIPFRRFMRKNLRSGPLLKRLLAWNWMRSDTAVEALAQRYHDLTRLTLDQLPDRPRFIFSATDMTFGVNWVFEKNRIGDYRAGYLRPAPAWPVARAVAASSCFPPVFSPLVPGVAPDELTGGTMPAGDERNALIRDLRLTDGGVYDNMGLEPVWKNHSTVLVSDGGATFGFGGGQNAFTRLLRYTMIIDNQVRSVRKRWLISGIDRGTIAGAYWGVSSATERRGYSKPVAAGILANVRTDLDAFSEAEIAALENHGYLQAEAAIQRYAPGLALVIDAPLVVPHLQWMDEQRVREALRLSHKRQLPLGRW